MNIEKELGIANKTGADRNEILVKAMEAQHEVYLKTFPVKEVDEDTNVDTYPPSTETQLKSRERSTKKFHEIARIFHKANEVTET